ncbi:PP2C family serine/threonine-protein phosphatase [Ramlibacter sp. WS9]|uniref:PP2C family protein-serine/threonine phosphatase n=1 Tax=Ramlibacter sp. WS9 TaxID=1882741 RepID=UPI0011439EE4|nr:PP2C family serine/threonine-protein phosphatase [Ramlibacter sp. WS9]ROZ78306.1 serine/threonine-protein phosphatase [Ramlibacter sp. WS9]
MISLRIALLSEPGGRKVNEDACGYWSSERLFCAVLADGAGGHGGGDVASRLAVQSLLSSFALTPSESGPDLASLVRQTNQAVLSGQTENTIQAQMHTTIVCLVIDLVDGRTHWAHSGDSRLYWFRDKQLVERTRDHSLVQSLVSAGLLEESKTRGHPKRSVLHSALGRQDAELELASSLFTPMMLGTDAFLLCSDGVWEHVPDDVLESLLTQADTPQSWLAGIGDAIKEATRSAATHDNYTALAVWLDESP